MLLSTSKLYKIKLNWNCWYQILTLQLKGGLNHVIFLGQLYYSGFLMPNNKFYFIFKLLNINSDFNWIHTCLMHAVSVVDSFIRRNLCSRLLTPPWPRRIWGVITLHILTFCLRCFWIWSAFWRRWAQKWHLWSRLFPCWPSLWFKAGQRRTFCF